jgi:hypothetical protein
VEKEKCRENVGFLTLRRCSNDATGKCGYCGKAVCAEHGQQTPGGIACISCLRQRGAETTDQSQQPDAARKDRSGPAATAAGYYGGYYDYQHYYDDYDYQPASVHNRFDEKDHSTLQAEAPDKGSYEEGFEGS